MLIFFIAVFIIGRFYKLPLYISRLLLRSMCNPIIGNVRAVIPCVATSSLLRPYHIPYVCLLAFL